jgi:hypothetical protein
MTREPVQCTFGVAVSAVPAAELPTATSAPLKQAAAEYLIKRKRHFLMHELFPYLV